MGGGGGRVAARGGGVGAGTGDAPKRAMHGGVRTVGRAGKWLHKKETSQDCERRVGGTTKNVETNTILITKYVCLLMKE